MSAHTKVRKVLPLVAGAHCEVTVIIHNLDPREADRVVERIVGEATAACADVAQLMAQRDQTEAEERAARLKALRDQIDPQEKVVSHGSAERHNQPQEPEVVVRTKKGRAK